MTKEEDWPLCKGCGKRHPSHDDLYEAIVEDNFTEDTYSVELSPEILDILLEVCMAMTETIMKTQNVVFIKKCIDLLNKLEALILNEVVESGLNLHSQVPIVEELHIRDVVLIIYLLEEYGAKVDDQIRVSKALNAFSVMLRP